MSQISNLSLSDVFFQALDHTRQNSFSAGDMPRSPSGELTTLPRLLSHLPGVATPGSEFPVIRSGREAWRTSPWRSLSPSCRFLLICSAEEGTSLPHTLHLDAFDVSIAARRAPRFLGPSKRNSWLRVWMDAIESIAYRSTLSRVNWIVYRDAVSMHSMLSMVYVTTLTETSHARDECI